MCKRRTDTEGLMAGARSGKSQNKVALKSRFSKQNRLIDTEVARGERFVGLGEKGEGIEQRRLVVTK